MRARGFISATALKWLAIAAAVAALVFAVIKGYESWRHSVFMEGDRAGAARVKATWDEDRAKAQEAALKQAADDLRETKQRMALQERSNRYGEEQRAAAVAAAGRARTESVRVLEWAEQRVADADAAAAEARAADPAAGERCEAAAASARVLADVFGRADERAGVLAEYADRARIAGEQCVRDYQALSAEPHPAEPATRPESLP